MSGDIIPFNQDTLATNPDLAARVAAEPIRIPAGYGMRVYTTNEKLKALARPDDDGLFDVLLVYEPPRRGKLYTMGVDVCSGMGADRSVIDVCRVGDLDEGEEQVAQFITYSTEPADLAYIIDPVGRFYADRTSQLPAMAAIELNGFGLGVLSELTRHVGYSNLFIWQHEDAISEQSRFMRSYGWYTTSRTRPLILQRYFRGIKTIDPNTKLPDYRVNSPHTLAELADFKTAGALWEGEGDPYDDCIMAGAISVHVAQTLQFEQREPLAESRRRRAEEKARAERAGQLLKTHISPLHTDVSVEELEGQEGQPFTDFLDNRNDGHYL